MAKKTKQKTSGENPEGEADRQFSTLRVRRERAVKINKIATALNRSVDGLFEMPEVVSFFNLLGVKAFQDSKDELEQEVKALPRPPKPQG